MREVVDFFKNLLKFDDFRSLWLDGSWTDFHAWVYIVSNLFVWAAFFFLPVLILTYAIRQNRPIKFGRFYFLFTGAILICGSTFLIDSLMFWVPAYRVSTLIRFITAVISWAMVFYVTKYLPIFFALRSGRDMQMEIAMRAEVEKELMLKNEQLQEAEHLAKLGYIQWDVAREKIDYSDSVPDILELRSDQRLNYELLSELIHPDDVKQLDTVIDTIFIRKFFPNFYCRIKVPGNELKHLLVIGQVILAPNGAIAAIKGTIQDVTEQRLYIQRIQNQNQKLKDIAWIQSHKVRAPVASILGLIQLFNKEDLSDPTNAEVLQGVAEATATLDDVIKEINAKTENDKLSSTEAEPT
jgi:PAS domain-containing protein